MSERSKELAVRVSTRKRIHKLATRRVSSMLWVEERTKTGMHMVDGSMNLHDRSRLKLGEKHPAYLGLTYPGDVVFLNREDQKPVDAFEVSRDSRGFDVLSGTPTKLPSNTSLFVLWTRPMNYDPHQYVDNKGDCSMFARKNVEALRKRHREYQLITALLLPGMKLVEVSF